MSWQPAEKVQKNSKGEYRALIGGEWTPVSKAQKNTQGQYRVMVDSGSAPATEKTGFPGASVIEPIATMATGIAGSALGGLAGIGQSANPLADKGAGADAVEKVRSALTYTPKTEAGQAGLETLGRLVDMGVDVLSIPFAGLGAVAELVAGQGLDQAAKTINSIRQEGVGKTLGNRAFEETGIPMLATVAETLPDAVSSIIGTKAGMMAADVAKQTGRSLAAVAPVVAGKATKAAESAVQAANKLPEKIFQYQTPARQKIAEKLKSGSTDSDTARFVLKGDKAVKDDIAQEAIKQGLDEGVIAAIKNASRADKDAMRKMTYLMQRGKKNAREAVTMRPADVAGDTLLNVYRSVRQSNMDAASKLDDAAKSLKGKSVDFSGAVGNFLSDLENMGVSVNTAGRVTLDFAGSDIEGLAGIEKAVNRVIKRMANTKAPDAYDVHRMKKYIDQIVNYGTSGETGLKGSVETLFKRLRRNLDQSLDAAFPEYNKVNTVYAETRGAIDALQDAAGKKLPLSGDNSDKAVGTLLRRLLSNTQSRTRLMDAISDLDAVEKKHGGRDLLKLEGPSSGKNDLITQVLFVDELDRVFGPVARTSFQGQIDQAVKGGIRAATGGMKEAAINAAGNLAEKARNINEEAAFKSIYDLLKR